MITNEDKLGMGIVIFFAGCIGLISIRALWIIIAIFGIGLIAIALNEKYVKSQKGGKK